MITRNHGIVYSAALVNLLTPKTIEMNHQHYFKDKVHEPVGHNKHVYAFHSHHVSEF